MGSIRSQIISGFLGVIILIGVIGIATIIYQSVYERVEERRDHVLYLEFGLVERAKDMVGAFNAYRLSGTDEARSEYDASRLRLQEDMADVERDAARGRRIALPGFLHTLRLLVESTDRGVGYAEERNLVATSEAYDESNRLLQFVDENVSGVVIGELLASQNVRERHDALDRIFLVTSGVLMLLIMIGSVFYASRLANSIAQPLVSVDEASTRLRSGVFDTPLPGSLLSRSDEIGSLARTFQSMADSLKTTLEGLRKSQEELKYQNILLEKSNKLFVIREGRIAELKKEVDDLKKKQA